MEACNTCLTASQRRCVIDQKDGDHKAKDVHEERCAVIPACKPQILLLLPSRRLRSKTICGTSTRIGGALHQFDCLTDCRFIIDVYKGARPPKLLNGLA